MLTKRDADAFEFDPAKPATARQILWDRMGSGKGNGSIPGFGIRVYESGKKAFVLTYRVKATGQQRTMLVGKYGSVTLEQARAQVKVHLGSMAQDDKKDPLAEQKGARQGKTFKEFWIAYLERHAKRHKKSWQEDQRRFRLYLDPAFGGRRIDAITRDDIVKFHYALGQEKPYQANRCVEQLSKMYELARLWGWVAPSHSNPAKSIQSFKEEKRDRWISPEELPRLMKAIAEEPNQFAKYAFHLYLLTGVRREELLHAKWEDVDLVRNELRLAETKSNRVHYVPLSPEALDVLRKIPVKEGNPYIIVGQKPGQHLVNIEKIWKRVRKTAGLEDVRLHDLRRTVGSWLAQSGNSLHLIGKVLNHSSQSTTAVYARFAEDHVRQAMNEHGKKIAKISKQK